MKKGNIAKILIVDDEEAIRRTFHSIFELEPYDVHEAADGVEAIEKCKKNRYDVIFLDIKMPRKDGMETLDELRDITPQSSIIMISGHATIDTAMECTRRGAFDFIMKPADYNRILLAMRNALNQAALVTQTETLKRKIATTNKVQEIIGQSDGIRRVKQNIDLAAQTDKARVLILGPNGSGKELVARWIHEKSERAGKPFVEVNCAAIPKDLIESELFGHMKGAFTGAVVDKAGMFEVATGGTIFLDEIGDMSFDLQAKILRALQEDKIRRIGGKQDISVDVRVIAATNKDLLEEIDNKNFREDLYHRLAVVVINVPPLNERRDDVSILCRHYMSKLSDEYGKTPKEFTDEAMKMLVGMNWSGNIRQLRNVVERLIILCPNISRIEKEQIVEHVLPTNSRSHILRDVFNKFDRKEDLLNYVAQEYETYKQSRR